MEEVLVQQPHLGPAPEIPHGFEAQVAACKSATETDHVITTTSALARQENSIRKDKGKAVAKPVVRKVGKDKEEPADIIPRLHPPRNGQLPRGLTNEDLERKHRVGALFPPEAARKTLALPLFDGPDIEEIRPQHSKQTTQPEFAPSPKRRHPSKVRRIVSRLLPFLQLKTDLWVRLDVPMDPGLMRNWKSNLDGLRITFLTEGLEQKCVIDLVMAGCTSEKDKMEPTVMVICERDYLDKIKSILKDSPYIGEGCKLRFVEGTPQECSCGTGLSRSLIDWKLLSVEAFVSNNGRMCGVKARAFADPMLHTSMLDTEAFTVGGLVLINDRCYALTTAHSLMRSNLATTVPSDGHDYQALGQVYDCELSAQPTRDDLLDTKYMAYDWALVEVPRSLWAENRITLPKIVDNLDVSSQDQIDPADDNPTIPITGYIRSDQISSSRVWIARTSGIAQQGILNQNIAFVFINGLGLYVRSILLQVPLVSGDSGAWVIQDGKLCGYIYGGIENKPWAYMIPIDSVFDRISSVLDGRPQIEVPSQSQITAILNQKVTGTLQANDPAQLAGNSQQSQGPGLEVSNDTHEASRRADGPAITTHPMVGALNDLEITVESHPSPPESRFDILPVASENSKPLRIRTFIEETKNRARKTIIVATSYVRVAIKLRSPQIPPVWQLDNNMRPAHSAILAEIDRHSFNWRVFFAAGSGMLSAAYSLSVSSVILPHLSFIYWPQDASSIHTTQIQITTLVGALIGSLISGYLADRYGRRKIYGMGLLIMVISFLGLAESSAGLNNQTMALFGWIIAWRFFAGLGIGWVWTLSAIITAEFAPAQQRARMMAAVFTMQSLGQLLASSLGIITLLGIGGQHNLAQESDHTAAAAAATVDTIWRLIAGLGGVCVLPAIFFRLLIPESPRFALIKGDSKLVRRDIILFYQGKGNFDDIELENMSVDIGNDRTPRYPPAGRQMGDYLERLDREGDDRDQAGDTVEMPQVTPTYSIDNVGRVSVADIDVDSNADDPGIGSFSFKAMWLYLKHGEWRYLCGTSACSFLLSFAFGSLGGSDQVVLARIWSSSPVSSSSTSSPIYDALHSNATQSLLTISIGSVLGSIVAFLAINYIRRNKVLITTSCILAILFVIAGIALAKTTATSFHAVTIVVYALCYFWYNMGPNVLIFMIPAEIFPTTYRGTCYAIVTASGRLGSILGEIILNNFRNDGDYSAFGWTLLGFSGLILGAAFFAWMWIPGVQYKGKLKHQVPNATLEEIAYAMNRARDLPARR